MSSEKYTIFEVDSYLENEEQVTNLTKIETFASVEAAVMKATVLRALNPVRNYVIEGEE